MSKANSIKSNGADPTDSAQQHALKALEQLERFFCHLNASGFIFDARQRAAATKILLAWTMDSSIGQLSDLLSPIFCRTSKEQRKFRKIAESSLLGSISFHLQKPEQTRENGSRADLSKDNIGKSLERSSSIKENGNKEKSKKLYTLISKNLREAIQYLSIAALLTLAGIVVLASIFLEDVGFIPKGGNGSIPNENPSTDPPGEEFTIPQIEPLPDWNLPPFWLPALFFLIWFLSRRLIPEHPWRSRSSRTLEGDPALLRIPERVRDQLTAELDDSNAIADLLVGRIETASHIDVDRTIEATAAQGGALIPIYDKINFPPEYLVLIERHAPHDHIASLFETLIARLVADGVYIERYYYRRDPRFLTSPEFRNTRSLGEVLEQFGNRRLMVIGTTENFFHPITGEPEKWLDALNEITSRFLLNTKELSDWDWRELELLNRGFTLAMATSEGLSLVGQRLGRDHNYLSASILGARVLDSDPIDTNRNVENGRKETLEDSLNAISASDLEPARILISYVEADKNHLENFLRALLQFKNEDLIDICLDQYVNWPDRSAKSLFRRLLDNTAIYMSLVSQNQQGADPIGEKLIMGIDSGKQTVPIIVDDCDWALNINTSLNALPTASTSIDSYDDPEVAWDEIAWKVRSLAIAHRSVSFRDMDIDWCPEMVIVPAGRFTIGSRSGEIGRYPDREGPQRDITIQKPFAIGRYPITFYEYDQFCMETDRPFIDDQGWGRANMPIMNVSWFDAQSYMDWLSATTGATYQLPSEIEWEYSARAGSTTRYCFGDDLAVNRANFYGSGMTTVVGTFPPNAWGLYDVHGNVWEWTVDDYKDVVKSYTPANITSTEKVICGGSWSSDPLLLRSAMRERFEARNSSDTVGFRVLRYLQT